MIATNLATRISLEQQLTNLPAVASVESITRFLSEDQSRKLHDHGDEDQAELGSISFLRRSGPRPGRYHAS